MHWVLLNLELKVRGKFSWKYIRLNYQCEEPFVLIESPFRSFSSVINIMESSELVSLFGWCCIPVIMECLYIIACDVVDLYSNSSVSIISNSKEIVNTYLTHWKILYLNVNPWIISGKVSCRCPTRITWWAPSIICEISSIIWMIIVITWAMIGVC